MAGPRLIFQCDDCDHQAWRLALARELPSAELHFWPDFPSEPVDYALLWQPDEALLARLSEARALFSLGAGVDHLLSRSSLPAGVPLVRLVDPLLTEGMTHYLLYQVLGIHRRFDDYRRQQSGRQWRQLRQLPAAATRISVLGMGELGQAAALALRDQGFTVSGWSRRPRRMDGVHCEHGEAGLRRVLAEAAIVILLLPLTADTRDLLDAERLAWLRPSTWLINVGRGALLDERALLAALDSGHLAGACLDVFRQEPLPADHPLWSRPNVQLTPHVASLTTPDSAAAVIGAQIRRHWSGGELQYRVDRSAGY